MVGAVGILRGLLKRRAENRPSGARETRAENDAEPGRKGLRRLGNLGSAGAWPLRDGAAGRNWTERLPVRFAWLAAA